MEAPWLIVVIGIITVLVIHSFLTFPTHVQSGYNFLYTEMNPRTSIRSMVRGSISSEIFHPMNQSNTSSVTSRLVKDNRINTSMCFEKYTAEIRNDKDVYLRHLNNLKFADHIKVNTTLAVSNGSVSQELRLLCIIYTVNDHVSLNHIQGARSIYKTWAKRCTGFIAASNETNEEIGAVQIPHEGPESYQNMWQKTRGIWKYVYENYIDDFDFFYICGDDNFVVSSHPYLSSVTGCC